MSKHLKLLGPHPEDPNMFFTWLTCTDAPEKGLATHRHLTEQIVCNDDRLTSWLAELLIHHHYDQGRIERLKSRYSDLGYKAYAELHRNHPRADRTKKGNAAEILLVEYIESCLGRELIKTYKLRYNPNVDQAIKGDDTLMLDLQLDKDGNDDVRIYLGESKFRKSPTKRVMEDLATSLGKEKMPISYSFLINELYRNEATIDVAGRFENFILTDLKAKGRVTYTGFLMSNERTQNYVDSHFTSDNPDLILISVGIANPEVLIEEAYMKVEAFLNNPAIL